ncbi:MAG: hypothetical protein JWR01_1520 [Subtercola sp.]|nr:hypothetical protein [Subtercola sp.]
MCGTAPVRRQTGPPKSKPLPGVGRLAYRETMSDTNIGTDGTIPNSDDGIAVGHDPDGSHFNPEEESGPATTPATTAPTTGEEESGSYTDTEGDDREDRPAEQDGTYTDADE